MTVSGASDTQARTRSGARLRAAFAAVPLLAVIPPEIRDRVWVRSRPGRSRAGDALFVHGDEADDLVLLLAGEVLGKVETANGRSVIVARWTAPCALDKVAVLSGHRHSCTAWVERDCQWRRLSRAELHRLVDDVPALRRHAVRTLARTASAERTRHVQTATGASFTRLAAHLCAEAVRTGAAEIPTTHQRLAEALGVSRVTVTRSLALLARDGLVRTGRNVVHIVSVDGLAAARDRVG